MIPLSLQDVQMIVAGAVFFLGCLFILLGTLILVTRGYSKEVRSLAARSAQLSQKGMTEDMADLVNSAAGFVGSLSHLVRTASGVGIFLISLGLGMFAATYWIVLQIEWPLA